MTDSKKKVAVLVRISESQNEYIEKVAEQQGGSSKAEVIRQIIAKAQMLQEP
jgi:outer membrane protein assembly factor BamA